MSTARPFAYNTGSTITGTEQVGNLAIGTPTSGFTSTGLRWWNGPNEDLGYVIAHPTVSGTQPNPDGVSAYLGFWRSDSLSDNSFISLSEYVSFYNGTPQSFSTTTQAKSWLNTNGFWTSYNPLVTSGLTLQLIASDNSSYPGSGSTWYDLSSPQQNITLINSPTFTSASPSYFSFNAINQYGTGSGLVLPATEYTKSVWFYLNAVADNNLVSSATGGHFMFFGAGTSTMYCGHANWPSYTAFPSVTTFSLNTWYNATLTFNTTNGMVLYINGVQDSTYTANKSQRGGDGSTNIATFNGGNLLNGRISKVYCYNRALNSSEVLQNFNYDKSNFGL